MQNELNKTVINNEPLSATPITDIDKPGFLKLLDTRILSDIDNYCATVYDDGHRNHMGASLIADDCKRKLWYGFRWVKHEKHNGRQQRLFNRGHREEARFVEWLKGTGFQVWDADENGDQFRVSFGDGHGGGSLDAIIKFPPSYGIDMPVLGEFKTNGTGAGFNKVKDSGFQIAKPIHWGQTCIYGSDPKYNFSHVLYMNINKNDDDLHLEVKKLDHALGNRLRDKAVTVIKSQLPPDKISKNSAYSACKWCSFSDICHKEEPVEINCRSCKYAVPIDNKQWFCSNPNNNGVIPSEFIPKGCGEHISINKGI